MAKLEQDSAKTIWDQMEKEKSWQALQDVLAQRRGKLAGIEDCTVIALLAEVKDRQDKWGDFPDSPGKLAELLNKDLERYLKEADCSGTVKTVPGTGKEQLPNRPPVELATNDWREEETIIPGEFPHSGARANLQMPPDEEAAEPPVPYQGGKADAPKP